MKRSRQAGRLAYPPHDPLIFREEPFYTASEVDSEAPSVLVLIMNRCFSASYHANSHMASQ